ncbi:MAG: hypothetical protein IKU86_02345 [Thermoguttaceae bacterium]|nr:hypothetical protein [Thermoguttaceae bacterium]
MKMFAKNFWRSLSVGVVALAAVASFGAVKAQDCPFADDGAIFYYSPSTIGNAGSIAAIWKTTEFDRLFGEATKKIDAELAEKLAEVKDEDDFPREKFEYLNDLLTKELGEKPTAASMTKAYFKYVDGVAFACDAPSENVSKPWRNLSLTWIVGFNPAGLDLAKLCGDDLDVVKDEDGVYMAKLTVKKDGNSETVYLGGVKIKDLDKYAVVLAGSQATLETKLTRFQASNDFVVKRLNDESVYSEIILKTSLFERVAVELAKDEKNEGAQAFKGGVEKIKSLRVKTLDVDGTFALALELEAVDAKAAKEFNDLAVGGVALLSLTSAKKELKPEEKFALELLKSAEFKCEKNSNAATATLKIDADKIMAIAGWIGEKIDEAIKKAR